MAKLRLIQGRTRKRVLVYGMRLFDADAVVDVGPSMVRLRDGDERQITLHVIEGTLPQIKKQLAASIDAFFELQEES